MCFRETRVESLRCINIRKEIETLKKSQEVYVQRTWDGKVKTKNLFQFCFPPWLILLDFTSLRTVNPFNFFQVWERKK